MSKVKINKTNKWTESDYNELRRLYSNGMTTNAIATKMGRTFYSISKKVSILGLSKEAKNELGLYGLGVANSKTTKMIDELKKRAKMKGYTTKTLETIPSIVSATKDVLAESTETKIKDTSKKMTKLARQIARANGKRITMALFFVEDL